MSVVDDNSDYSGHSEYRYPLIVKNWFSEHEHGIYIMFNLLTNEIVNDPEFTIKLNYNKHITCDSSSYYEDIPKFDINNLISKMIGLKSISIPYYIRNKITTFPETLEKIICYNQNIEKFEKYTNLKHFEFIDYSITFLVPQFSYGLKTIIIHCKSLDGSLGYLPETVEEITLSVNELNNSFDSWPYNLKKLSIVIVDAVNGYTIEMLPPSLESFTLAAPSYLHYIDFPPCLKLLHFLVDDIDSPYIANIPDTVVNYAINYKSQKEIDKLPKKCKVFTYSGCPEDIHKNLTKNVKGVAFYTKRIKNYDY